MTPDTDQLQERPTQVTAPTTRRPSPVRRWMPLVLVVLVLLLPLRGLIRATGSPMEEGFMLVFPERVLHGAIPNVDFLHLYGTLSLWVLAAVYKVFGVSLLTERLFGFAQKAALVLAIFALARLWGRWLAAAAASIAAIIIVPPVGLAALAWVGGVALAIWSVVAALEGRHATDDIRARRWLIAAGVLGGFALLYRPDLILAVGLGLGAAAWGAGRRCRNRLIVGVALGLAPEIVHIIQAGPNNVLQGMILDPIFRLRGGRRLPLPPPWGRFDSFLDRAAQLIKPPPWPFPTPPKAGQIPLWLGLLLASVALLLIVARMRLRRDPSSSRGRTLLVAALLSVGLLPQGIQRADSTHLAWVSFLPIGFLVIGVAELLSMWRPAWSLNRRGVLAAATPLVLLVALAPNFTLRAYEDPLEQTFGFRYRTVVMRNGSRVFYYGRTDAQVAVNTMVQNIDQWAKPGQRLVVGTGDLRKTPYSEAFLYYLLPQLTPATYYIEMDPGVANAPGSKLAGDIASADVVILSSVRDDWVEPNDSRKLGSDVPNQVLHRDFCLARSYGVGLFGHGLYELYFRCDHMPPAASQ
jgi:hypothetical protein